MIKKKVVLGKRFLVEKEIDQIERQDVIEAVSKFLGRDVQLNELDVQFELFTNDEYFFEGGDPQEWDYRFFIDESEIESQVDDDGNFLYPLSDYFDKCDYRADPEDFFAFDVNEFKSFSVELDEGSDDGLINMSDYLS